MKIKHTAYIVMLALLVGSSAVVADQYDESNALPIERNKVIDQYINDLKKADYKDIVQLFEKNGVVVSTSRGRVNAKDFFYSFLQDIETASSELHQLFIGETNDNHFTARFHFTYKMKDGETGDGEYIDEFVFSGHSKKLSAVYMFENLKFNK